MATKWRGATEAVQSCPNAVSVGQSNTRCIQPVWAGSGRQGSKMTGHQDGQWIRRTRDAFVMAALIAVLAACQQNGARNAPGESDGASQGKLAGGQDGAITCADITTGLGDRVLFDLDSAELRPEARGMLDQAAAKLLQMPSCRFVIEGHCDERGTREYNLALGDKRAHTVMTYLAALGVDQTRMETVSYGKERPAVLGSDEEAWAKNRRAVMVSP